MSGRSRVLEGGSQAETGRASATAAAEPTHPFQLRASEFGGYRVERIVSTGALGAVIAARHCRHEHPVVIKLLHPELRNDPLSAARISREAHVLARLPHPNIVRLLDSGWTEQVGPYLVLEHLVGMDLGRMLESRGPLRVPLAVDFLLQVCDALGVVHAAGISHRDLKPENLFAVEPGAPAVKLLDFGIARHGPESSPHRDVAAALDAEEPLLGTPAYLSPERIRCLPNTDHRCDIWSLGVVLHELVTGRTPFGRGNTPEICERVLRHEYELEANRTLLPSPLRAVILRCLARHPVSRYQSVQHLAEALRRATTLPERCRGQLTGKFQRESALQAQPATAPLDLPRPAAVAREAVAREAVARTAVAGGAAAGRRPRQAMWWRLRDGTFVAILLAVVLVLLSALAVSWLLR